MFGIELAARDAHGPDVDHALTETEHRVEAEPLVAARTQEHVVGVERDAPPVQVVASWLFVGDREHLECRSVEHDPTLSARSGSTEIRGPGLVHLHDEQI